jgi:putative hydrolase of HD superfamily
MNGDMKSIVNFFFETGFLQRLQRSGNDFLGSGNQTVGSHIFRTVVIGYALAKLSGADILKTVLMCLFHDIEESRTGDLNYLQQRYVKSYDEKALNGVVEDLPFGKDIKNILMEFESQETFEATLAKDADTIELILYLKEEYDKGNQEAKNWIYYAKKRLINEISVHLVKEIENTSHNEWWKSVTDKWDKGNKSW